MRPDDYWKKVSEEREEAQRKQQERTARKERSLKWHSIRAKVAAGRDSKAKGDRRYAARFTSKGVRCRSCKRHRPEDSFSRIKKGRLKETCKRCDHKKYLARKRGPKPTPSVEKAMRERHFRAAQKRLS